jgi:uncharacterized membrane protein
MESRARFLGHPVHPLLVMFPLGLFIMALVFDVIYFITANNAFATVSFWDIAAGIIGGLLAAVFGLIDWLNIPDGTRAKSIGMWHGLGNVVVVVLFAVSWWLRYGAPTHVPGAAAFILALIGVGISAATGWMGGELVDRLGVGVSPGAHLDAPSSLSGLPADANVRPAGSTSAERLRGHDAGR